MIATLQPDLFDPTHAGEPETRTETGPAAVLYRCHPCERRTKQPHVWRQTFTRAATTRTWWSATARRQMRLAEITWTDDTTGRRSHGEQPPHASCPGCHRPTFGQAIRGRYNAATRCDARCIYAKGPDCECSCGGANHGAGHQPRTLTPERTDAR